VPKKRGRQIVGIPFFELVNGKKPNETNIKSKVYLLFHIFVPDFGLYWASVKTDCYDRGCLLQCLWHYLSAPLAKKKLMSALALKNITECKKNRSTSLDLGDCGLTEIPEEVFDCVWLETLILSHKWREYDVKTMDLGIKNSQNQGEQNNITALPPVLSRLSNLKVLIFDNNPISDLSPLKGLADLQILDCFATQVSDLSPLAGLAALQRLYCSETKVSDLSPLAGLADLQQLSCFTTPVSDLSPLAGLAALQILDCSSTPVSDLSPLAGLADLQRLYCSKTQVSDLSPLAGLAALQRLYCYSTQVSDLSPLAGLAALQILYCYRTRVSDLSPLAGLAALQILSCFATQVSDLSPLKGLAALQILDCSSTPVKKIFPLTQITALAYFKVDGCPIEDCPADIYQSENVEILRAFFKEKQLANTPPPRPLDTRRDVKLILLGNSDAGKTSLLHFLKTGGFLEERNSTHGLEVHRWLPDAARFPALAEVAVSIWDFGGQEYYHGAYRLFMSDNAVYLLLWDAETDCNGRRKTCLKTGEGEIELEHFEKKYWLDTVRHFGGEKKDTPLLVVQNKTDRKSGKKRLDQSLHDAFGIHESLHISLKAGCQPNQPREKLLLQHFEIELAQALAATADQTSLPLDWLSIRQSILDLQDKKGSPFLQYLSDDGSISLEDFEKGSAEVIGKALAVDQRTLPGIFKRGGVVVFFPDSASIGERVFLKPADLAERIYTILRKQVLDLGGEFEPKQIFKKEEESFQSVFLEVAQNLELIFPHPDNNKAGWFIAPQYLPERHPIEDLFKIASHGTWQSAFWLKVPLFYYKKLLHSLVLHYASDPGTEARHFWKHGIVFLKNGLRVLVKGLYPAEDERDGVLLVGVEQGGDGAHLVLQKEIFERCLYFLTVRGGEDSRPEVKEKGENLTRKIDLSVKMRNPEEEFASGRLNIKAPLPNWLEVSKDNEFFVKYNNLTAAAEKDDIRIEGISKSGAVENLLIRAFEPLLPRPPRRAKKVFVSYSHRNTHWLGRLRAHLGVLRRSNLIETWTDQEILPGDQWDKSIKDKLADADVFILLLSADFIESNYIWDVELKTAFEKYQAAKKMILPILVEPLDLGGLPGVIEIFDPETKVPALKIQDFEIVPKDANGYLKAVSLWSNHEEALAIVAQRIRAAVHAKT